MALSWVSVLLPRAGRLQGLLFTPSSPIAKMPTPRTLTSGPELHGPQEPVEPQTPVKGTRRASSGEAPSAHREDAKRGMGTFPRAPFRVGQRASGRASKEDPGLLRRSSRFLFRSLRRPLDSSPAAHPCQGATVPGTGHSPEVPSGVIDGVSQQLSPKEGPEELEPEAGEGCTNKQH